ncbi:MAG: hypothetical protein Q9214_003940, partial [Letrouitia sp. 1 TL-2023]
MGCLESQSRIRELCQIQRGSSPAQSTLRVKLTGLQQLSSNIERVMKDHHEVKDRKTIFDEILESRLSKEDKKPLRLLQEAQNISVAGTATTALVLSHMSVYLLSTPRVLAQLRAELKRAIPNPAQPQSIRDIEQLPYLDAVVTEGLRLTMGTSRRQTRISPYEIMTFCDEDKVWHIPAGVSEDCFSLRDINQRSIQLTCHQSPVGMAAPLIHLSPTLFPDPLEFRPERFIENPGLKRHLITFAQGSRQCLGMQMATIELLLLHAEIWRRYGSKEDHGEDGWWELYETDRSDIGFGRDRFLPYPKKGSRVIQIKCALPQCGEHILQPIYSGRRPLTLYLSSVVPKSTINMSADKTDIVGLIDEIYKVKEDLITGDFWSNNPLREKLISNAEKLASVARKPEETILFQSTQSAQNFAIRTAVDLALFDRIPSSGSGISIADLSRAVNVDERLLARILRACTSISLFQELRPSHYIHTPLSSVFLHSPHRDHFTQIYDFTGRAVYMMPYYLRATRYRYPIEYSAAPFQYALHTPLGFWEYLDEDPRRARLFSSGMRSFQSATTSKSLGCTHLFYEELLLQAAEIGSSDVAVVDVGGGRGQALEGIQAQFPELEGRLILQDREDVIEDAKAKGLLDSIETMAVSFFDAQVVEGAFVYQFRRILHDWSDDSSISILKNTVRAMTSRSRVLIIETIMPETEVPRRMALQDINMMTFG